MTAPLTQGSLGRSRARRFFDSLKDPLQNAADLFYLRDGKETHQTVLIEKQNRYMESIGKYHNWSDLQSAL